MAEAVKEEPADYDETAAPVVPEYVSIPDSFNEDEDSKCDINLGEISSTDTDEKVDIKHDSEYYQQFLDKEPWDAGEGTSKQPDGDVKPSGLVESIKEEFDSENSDMEDENGEDNEDSKSLFEEQLHDVKDADSDEDGEQFPKLEILPDHKCEYCDNKASRMSNVKQHAEAVQNNSKTHKCELCDQKTYRKFMLHLHAHNKLQNHYQLKEYPCEFCDFVGSCYANLRRHLNRMHNPARKQECKLCDYVAKSNHRMKCHMDSIHNPLNDRKCGSCGYLAGNHNDLQKHIKSEHFFRCKHCDYASPVKSDIRKHVMRTHTTKPETVTANSKEED